MRALIVLAGLLLGAGRAHADDREQARREFAAGQAADRAGSYQLAIEHYLRAHERVPHHFALFNIATNYERLGQYREAARWFTRYLESPHSTDRDKVQRQISALSLRPAELTVISRPAGAQVWIDNQLAGVTPYVKTIRGGGHRLSITLGERREERDFVLEFGEPRTVEVILRGAPSATTRPTGPSGTLQITGTPPGATVAVDQQVIGTLPVQLPVAAGAHTVSARKYGYAPFETEVTVAPDASVPVAIDLKRATPKETAKRRVSYLLGAAAGLDAGGTGALVLGEIGMRALQYDVASRVGLATGALSVELLVRYTVTTTRVAPFIGMGYSLIGSGFNLEFLGGLRIDLSRGDRLGMALLAEVGVRSYAVPETDPSTPATTTSGKAIPVLVSFQIMMDRQR